MKINNKGKGALIAAITAAATLLSCGLAAASASAAGVDYLPAIGQVPTYTKFQPTADPGKNASDYFQPYWYAKNANDNGGTHIQAHGGQVVKVGDAYYWYGEDRSNGYDNSPRCSCLYVDRSIQLDRSWCGAACGDQQISVDG